MNVWITILARGNADDVETMRGETMALAERIAFERITARRELGRFVCVD